MRDNTKIRQERYKRLQSSIGARRTRLYLQFNKDIVKALAYGLTGFYLAIFAFVDIGIIFSIMV